MGYSLSWVAVKGRPDQAIHQSLHLKKTGRFGNCGKDRIVGRTLNDGWYIVIANECDDPITQAKILATLSKGCEVVACSIEEHVMFSSAAYWKKGKKVWSVKHRGEEGSLDIVKSGKVPESYARLEKELFEAQKAEGGESADIDHVFDLPLVLATQVVGFRHDEEDCAPRGEYEILELGRLQRVSSTIRGALPWLYLVGGLLLIGLVMVVAADGVRRLIDWLLKLGKNFVS